MNLMSYDEIATMKTSCIAFDLEIFFCIYLKVLFL